MAPAEYEGHRDGGYKYFFCLRTEPAHYECNSRGSFMSMVGPQTITVAKAEDIGQGNHGDQYYYGVPTWNASNSEITYSSVDSRLNDFNFKSCSLVNGICYQLARERMINNSWDRLKRTRDYLKLMKKTGEDCVEPMKRLIACKWGTSEDFVFATMLNLS